MFYKTYDGNVTEIEFNVQKENVLVDVILDHEL